MEPLLEREHELLMLTQLVDAACDGSGGVLLITGEAGIGKTSLVRAIRQSARGRATFLMGACEPLSVPVPLGPIRELAAAAGRRDLVDGGGDDRLTLARSLLDALVSRTPALVVLEDAHWADPATLDVIRLKGPHGERVPALCRDPAPSRVVGARGLLLLADPELHPRGRCRNRPGHIPWTACNSHMPIKISNPPPYIPSG